VLDYKNLRIAFDFPIGVDVLVKFGLEHELGMLGGHGLAFDSVLFLVVIFIDDEKNLSEGSSAQLPADLEFLEYDFAFTIEIALP
jgi:hypothetical protein